MASRTLFSRVYSVTRSSLFNNASRVPAATVSRGMSKHSTETDEQFDARYEAYFSRSDIDGWEIRKAMNDLTGMDLVPDPKIISAALKACRRVNDFSLAVRVLEAVSFKCKGKDDVYSYVMKEIQPTLSELGINTLEELGYDKPELGLKTIYEV